MAGAVPAHTAVQQARQGRVELWPAPIDPKQTPKVNWQPLQAADISAHPRAVLGQTIARHIHRLCYDAKWAHKPAAHLAEGRRVQPGDFLILLQNRKPNFSDALIAELKALGVPVTGVDRLKVSAELLVQDLLALGDICLQPGDDLALAALLKSPLYKWDEQRLYDLSIDRGQRSLMARLADQDPDLHAHFLRLRGQVGHQSVYEFYAAYLFAGGMRAHILQALGPEAEDILTVFLDRARAYDRHQNGDLLGFIEGERRSNEDLKRDSSESAGEVRLMTVHGAKGLEAPIVILPDLRDPSRAGGARTDDQLLSLPGVGPLWVPRSEFDVPHSIQARTIIKQAGQEERERLFYVALTRAEERLIIATDKARDVKPPAYSWFGKAKEAIENLGRQEDLALEDIGWDSSTGWVFGTYPEITTESQAEDLSAAQSAPLPPWIKTRLEMGETPQKMLSPSKLGGEEDVDAGQPYLRPQPSGRALALKRGTLIHAALEHLPPTQPHLWADRLNRFFNQSAPDAPQEERESWAQEVTQALLAPELAGFFGPNSQSEVSVSGQVQGHPALGQIDRLWVDRATKTVHILDYKTNRPPPKNVDQIPPAYRQQLDAYGALIQPLYPDFQVRTYLFWTHTTTLMAVS